jgi:hypothetical protein
MFMMMINLNKTYDLVTDVLAVSLREMDKVMETFVKDTRLFVNTEFD